MHDNGENLFFSVREDAKECSSNVKWVLTLWCNQRGLENVFITFEETGVEGGGTKTVPPFSVPSTFPPLKPSHLMQQSLLPFLPLLPHPLLAFLKIPDRIQ
jgi:hypothetical protein